MNSLSMVVKKLYLLIEDLMFFLLTYLIYLKEGRKEKKRGGRKEGKKKGG